MIDEGARFALTRRLVEALGEESAVTLMGHLPPSGWADVATRHDIDRLEDSIHRLEDRVGRFEQRTDARFDQLEQRTDASFDQLEQRFDDRLEARTRLFIGTTVSSMLATIAAMAGLLAIAGVL